MFFAISSLWKNIKNIEKQSQLSVKEDKYFHIYIMQYKIQILYGLI